MPMVVVSVVRLALISTRRPICVKLRILIACTSILQAGALNVGMDSILMPKEDAR